MGHFSVVQAEKELIIHYLFLIVLFSFQKIVEPFLLVSYFFFFLKECFCFLIHGSFEHFLHINRAKRFKSFSSAIDSK